MVEILKADGTREPFKREKLITSLTKAGAQKEEIDAVVSRIESELEPGMTTDRIYRDAFAYLRNATKPAAARYALRRALFGLGPTGFPFETFIGRIYKELGYSVRTGVHMNGKCAPHEIDIAAFTKDDSFVAEVKFHSRPDIKSDLQEVMYSYARKLDLVGVAICDDDHCGISDLHIITNTKFTSTATAYAACVGISLLSWNSPKEKTLYDYIEETGLYPVTVLTALSGAEQEILIKRDHIVCRDILERPEILRALHISTKKTETVLSEARQLCGEG